MIPGQPAEHQTVPSAPRVSGDDPPESALDLIELTCSPRERG